MIKPRGVTCFEVTLLKSSSITLPSVAILTVRYIACLRSEHQQTIHLRCYGLSRNSPAKDYWWGLEFYNTTIVKSINDFVIINESSSILENVDVLYAGVTKEGDPVPAIRASPSVPSLVNVRILNCALDATNFTSVLSSTIVYNSSVTNNRGETGFL